MSSITKFTSNSTPSNQRYQVWDTGLDTNDDGNPITEGDIFEIKESLHRPGKNLQITMDGAGSSSFRFNPRLTVYPRRPENEYNYASERYYFLASGMDMLTSGSAAVIIEAGESWALVGEMPVSEVELVTHSGNFRLFVN